MRAIVLVPFLALVAGCGIADPEGTFRGTAIDTVIWCTGDATMDDEAGDSTVVIGYQGGWRWRTTNCGDMDLSRNGSVLSLVGKRTCEPTRSQTLTIEAATFTLENDDVLTIDYMRRIDGRSADWACLLQRKGALVRSAD